MENDKLNDDAARKDRRAQWYYETPEAAERRRYALLQAAAILALHYPFDAVSFAKDLLAEIEQEEGK